MITVFNVVAVVSLSLCNFLAVNQCTPYLCSHRQQAVKAVGEATSPAMFLLPAHHATGHQLQTNGQLSPYGSSSQQSRYPTTAAAASSSSAVQSLLHPFITLGGLPHATFGSAAMSPVVTMPTYVNSGAAAALYTLNNPNTSGLPYQYLCQAMPSTLE